MISATTRQTVSPRTGSSLRATRRWSLSTPLRLVRDPDRRVISFAFSQRQRGMNVGMLVALRRTQMRTDETKTRNTAKLEGRGAREGGFFGFVDSATAPFIGSATKGAAFVEYVILLCLVVVGGSTALYSLGLPLVRMARFSQFVLGLPVP